jgi:hypothetical protein
MHSQLLLIIFSGLLMRSHALWVNVWADEHCRGHHEANLLRSADLYPTPVCNVRNDNESSLAVGMRSSADRSVYIIFYETEDCNPDSIVGVLDEGCSGVQRYTNPDYEGIKKWKSWTVTNMCEVEEPGCALDF